MGKRKLADYGKRGRGRIGEKYQLTIDEVQELRNLFDTAGLFEVIYTAFFVGVEAGYRSTRKGGKAR